MIDAYMIEMCWKKELRSICESDAEIDQKGAFCKGLHKSTGSSIFIIYSELVFLDQMVKSS